MALTACKLRAVRLSDIPPGHNPASYYTWPTVHDGIEGSEEIIGFVPAFLGEATHKMDSQGHTERIVMTPEQLASIRQARGAVAAKINRLWETIEPMGEYLFSEESTERINTGMRIRAAAADTLRVHFSGTDILSLVDLVLEAMKPSENIPG